MRAGGDAAPHSSRCSIFQMTNRYFVIKFAGCIPAERLLLSSRCSVAAAASSYEIDRAIRTRMTAEPHQNHAELLARSDEALWSWPLRCGAAMAEELAQICEQLAALLGGRDDEHGEERADTLAEDPLERTKLKFLYGTTLLTLAERQSPDLLPEAVTHLGQALSLARQHAPDHVVHIKSELYRAEHSLAMRHSPLRVGLRDEV
jgi:hypothetical protein